MRRTQGESQPLIWLNLLCLDAPLVAVAWQQAFARPRSLHISPAASAALFATAWLIYLVDRVADSLRVSPLAPRSARQSFAQRNRRLLSGAIILSAAVDVIAIRELDHATLAGGALIGAISLLYLAVNYFFSSLWRILPLKEIAIGLLFAAGVAASLGRGGALPFYLALMFGMLCALNCVSIAFWERNLDIAQDHSSIATALPHLRQMPGLAATLLAVIALGALPLSRERLPVICIGVSSASLAILNLPRLSLRGDTRTALADIVLLTPLAALPFAS